MSLKSSNQVATNRYQLEIELPGDVFEKAVEQVYRKENKKITIPGFRKGKAPRTYVEKVYGSQVDYVRSLPLHPLQEEVETTDEYSVFHYFFRPSYDFIQQVLWHRDMVEVLSPIELRQEICAVLRKALRRYGPDGEVRI